MGAGASLPANMQWIESNQGFIAVKEALGLAGEDKKNKLCYHDGDEMVILKKFMEMDRNGDGQLDPAVQITTRSENDNKECKICQTEVSLRMSLAMF